MAFFRTSTMAGMGKKHSTKSKSMDRNSIIMKTGPPGGGGRRHTMLPQQRQSAARDSVLSNGSSDRSSSLSDEMLLLSPPLPEPVSFTLSLEVEERIRESWPLKCSFVVKEVIQTEMAYVQSLDDIIKGYLTPLYSYLLDSGESPNFVKTVFSNIVKIHKTHQELLEAFQNTCSSPHDFGTIFLRIDLLSLYAVYCTNYAQGNECLEKSLGENDNLRDFIEHCQREIGHSLPLSSQLIKPVQRILKYRLLLDELNKHFDPQHPDCTTLQTALEKMASVAEQINTSFTSQKKTTRGVPSAVAKRRTNQLSALQKSRSTKMRNHRGSPPSGGSPVHSNLQSHKRSVSETHLNHPPQSSHTLPNGVGYRHGGGEFPRRRVSDQREELVDSLPKVKHLKSFFEQLKKDGDEDAKKGAVSGMKKASSMAGTKRDSISTVGLGSSPTSSPSSWSPNYSPTMSPIKVPVLPQSPVKSKFPPAYRTSPEKSPVHSPRKSSFPPISPSAVAKFTNRVSPPFSPLRSRRRSSVGSVADLRVKVEVIGESGGRRKSGGVGEWRGSESVVGRRESESEGVAKGVSRKTASTAGSDSTKESESVAKKAAAGKKGGDGAKENESVARKADGTAGEKGSGSEGVAKKDEGISRKTGSKKGGDGAKESEGAAKKTDSTAGKKGKDKKGVGASKNEGKKGSGSEGVVKESQRKFGKKGSGSEGLAKEIESVAKKAAGKKGSGCEGVAKESESVAKKAAGKKGSGCEGVAKESESVAKKAAGKKGSGCEGVAKESESVAKKAAGKKGSGCEGVAKESESVAKKAAGKKGSGCEGVAKESESVAKKAAGKKGSGCEGVAKESESVAKKAAGKKGSGSEGVPKESESVAKKTGAVGKKGVNGSEGTAKDSEDLARKIGGVVGKKGNGSEGIPKENEGVAKKTGGIVGKKGVSGCEGTATDSEDLARKIGGVVGKKEGMPKESEGVAKKTSSTAGKKNDAMHLVVEELTKKEPPATAATSAVPTTPVTPITPSNPTRAMAAIRISEEIKRQIALSKKAPRTIV